MQPINYSGMMTNADPAQTLLSGIKTGAVINDVEFQQKQQAIKQQMLQQQQQDLHALVNNPAPTAKDYANYTLRNPAQAKAATSAFGLLDKQQQQQKLGVASQVYSALQAGRADLADQILGQQEEALKNGGSPADLQSTQVLRQLVAHDPQQASHIAGIFLSSAMGPDNFTGAFSATEKANQDQALAPVKQQQAQLDLADTQSKIDTRASDTEIKRADTQIKALTAQLGKETNDIKRQDLQLKIQNAQTKRDQLATDKAVSGQGALASIDNALDTVSKIKTAPGLSGTVGLTGAVPNVPGSEASNAQALIDQLQSQSFLASIQQMKGLGALSDAEGAKLTNSIATLNTKQDEKQFRRQLDSIEQQFNSARQRVAKQHGIEGGNHAGVVLNHPTYGAITTDRLNAAAKKAGISPDELLKELQGNQ